MLQVSQSSLSYHHYPKDTQDISLQFFSVSLFKQQLTFDISVEYMYSAVNYPAYAVEENQIWTFDEAVASTGAQPPGTAYGARQYGLINIQVTRQATGIVLRLAFPTFLLVVLAALSFWADPEDRVNSTVTMLLAISALSIIVFGSIPMVGYLTTFDKFLTTMFVVLTGCCVLHLFTIRLRREDKLEKWPIRGIYVRLLECLGRTLILPIITLLYTASFRGTLDGPASVIGIIVVFIFSLFVGVREIGALTNTFKIAMNEVGEKFSDLKDLSTVEAYLFNLYMYQTFTASARIHLSVLAEKRKSREKEVKQRSKSQDACDVDSDDEDVGPGPNPNPGAQLSSSPRSSDNQEPVVAHIAAMRSSIEMSTGINPMRNDS